VVLVLDTVPRADGLVVRTWLYLGLGLEQLPSMTMALMSHQNSSGLSKLPPDCRNAICIVIIWQAKWRFGIFDYGDGEPVELLRGCS